jgi:hypothetical protein
MHNRAAALTTVEGTGPTRTRGLAAGVQDESPRESVGPHGRPAPRVSASQHGGSGVPRCRPDRERPGPRAPCRDWAAPAPHGLLPESVLVAVEHKAIAEGDVATLRELATGKLTSDATTMGQRIRALGERAPDSPVKAIQDVVERGAGARRTPQLPRPAKPNSRRSARDRQHADRTQRMFDDFVDSLKC